MAIDELPPVASLPHEPDRLGDSLNARTLRRLQMNSFNYFIEETNPENGLVLDKTADDWPASIAAMGMALTVWLVGARRHFITREEALQRSLTMLRFLAASEQGEGESATGYRGFYYHFLDLKTGARAWRCELSSVDTALLIAGALAAFEYFDRPLPDEIELRRLARQLYERVDWEWMLDGGTTLRHGWKPETGFLPYRWEGYDEALILYLLALGSPTHPIPPECYPAWATTYEWKTIYGIEHLYAGPLFIHQMSHIWCDFRGIRDAFMREHDCDYFENSRRATLVQQQYAIRNPQGFRHLDEMNWGITASDGPGNVTKKIDGIERTFYDYIARGAPYGPDDGTIAPWAVAASLPFAPEIVAPTISAMTHLHLSVPNPYGFKASFNPVFHGERDDPVGWVSPFHFGINEGPTVLMIENYRSGMIWQLMRHCAPLRAGLNAAGFSGGWLD
ncbi:glucoamylase family protein [Paucibacter sp. R3-3]|uniref:Glucoamylase family protein n=1 Tax=Roseateles agri TaxID=3098619 RepID=A0ABU5DGT0_9BURK|nr:glucoamylase family protein [Paucibacter sp. R3-3]MDY0745344.1 glucoamylase family protein [Paucibacter sp. R3-3]